MAHLSALRHAAGRPPASIPRRGARCCSASRSYLDMWRKAIERERQSQVLRSTLDSPPSASDPMLSRTETFNRILQVPPEERNRAYRLHVIGRAAAAIAATRALLKEVPKPTEDQEEPSAVPLIGPTLEGSRNNQLLSELQRPELGAPGPNFWSWSPPLDSESNLTDSNNPQMKKQPKSYPKLPLLLMEKERSTEHLYIPFESMLSQTEHIPLLPPLQSLVETKTEESLPTLTEEHDIGEVFSRNAAEAAEALSMADEAEKSSHGMYSDGTRWWKETGVETRPDGVVCKWTLIHGVSADETVEWEDKYWEASDQLDYKELGSEKSGRDASGNIWHEFWRESLWKDLQSGLMHIEKTADKRSKSSRGTEWGEKWWEHYNSSGQAEKSADKWCSIDRNTPLEVGHAHVWHERWGETYDGKGGSEKYTDKWAERHEGDGWSKWGDKWDEHFNSYGHGLKQGETWWQGKDGDCWNRTWGEGHNGSGWIHKYGKSSSGEHWDTHEREDTWYERFPHFGFDHCLQNSVQLQAVPKQPPSTSESSISESSEEE